jgi:hypothetical protein
MNRRHFIKTSTLAGIGMSVMAPHIVFGKDDRKARMGRIGVGLRGPSPLNLLLRRDDVPVKAICDIDPAAIEKSREMINEANGKKVRVFSDNEHAFLQLLERDNIDGVIIAAPWRWRPVPGSFRNRYRHLRRDHGGDILAGVPGPCAPRTKLNRVNTITVQIHVSEE